MMKKYFCVSDIHSFYEQLIKALSDKGFDINNKNHILIICGDAFDRGDDTIKVFELMKKLNAENRLIYIKGNHESLLIDCVNELLMGKTPSAHHFHNKTVKTICMICGQNEYIAYSPSLSIREDIKVKMDPIINFINDNCIDYFELGNKIFVHSWIPCKEDSNLEPWKLGPEFIEIHEWWDKNENDLKNEHEKVLFRDLWESARWGNPFLMWKKKLYPKNKCIVFGHFHTSYGHSRIDMKCKEWPTHNDEDKIDFAFSPWIKENAIGIDGCVAYSNKINCLVFDEDGNLIA